MDFGRFLRWLRGRTGKSIRQIARLAQISATYLGQVEAGGRNPPDPEFLRRLARTYGVAPVDLFRRAGYWTEQDMITLEQDELQRAYHFVISDPTIPVHCIPSGPPTVEMMQLVVTMYEALTGKRLHGPVLQSATPQEVVLLFQQMFWAHTGLCLDFEIRAPEDSIG